MFSEFALTTKNPKKGHFLSYPVFFQEFLTALMQHAKEFKDFHRNNTIKLSKVKRAVVMYHQNTEREKKKVGISLFFYIKMSNFFSFCGNPAEKPANGVTDEYVCDGHNPVANEKFLNLQIQPFLYTVEKCFF